MCWEFYATNGKPESDVNESVYSLDLPKTVRFPTTLEFGFKLRHIPTSLHISDGSLRDC